MRSSSICRLAILITLAAAPACGRTEPTPAPAGGAAAPAAGSGAPLVMRLSAQTNGLSLEERARYYHLSEGGELYPLDWLLTLEHEVTGSDGRTVTRPFMENIERFGLIPDERSAENPYGLPVGVTVAPSLLTGAPMIGLNCSTCHVG